MTSVVILQNFEKTNTIQPRAFTKDFSIKNDQSKLQSQLSDCGIYTILKMKAPRFPGEMAYFRTGAENMQDEPETFLYCQRI